MEGKGFKSGLSALVGRPNAGKSTLLNALVGTKVAIVTPRAQTTRDTYHGVINRPNGQIVLVDTPGVFVSCPNKLNKVLERKIRNALQDVNVIVHVADPTRSIGPEDNLVLELLSQATQPKILALNKLDMPSRPHREAWLARQKDYVEFVEISALHRLNLDLLVEAIFRHLTEGPAYYPEGQISNMTREFWIAEIIREKLFLKTAQEVPYTATVRVVQIEDCQTKDGQPLLRVKALILTTDERHQRMLIGRDGRKIKEIGTASRQELEVAMNCKVFLQLDVVVDEHWVNALV